MILHEARQARSQPARDKPAMRTHAKRIIWPIAQIGNHFFKLPKAAFCSPPQYLSLRGQPDVGMAAFEQRKAELAL